MKIVTIFLLLLSGYCASAQYRISGSISDEQTNEPIPGATIQCRKNKQITQTNTAGNFEIRSGAQEDSLYISAVGYTPTQVAMNKQGFQRILMKPLIKGLLNVTVTGYESNHKLIETAGAISILQSDAFQKGDNMDIVSTLNTIPGVKMEAASTGNYRMSIRGSLLNSPWAIRNVKIYWNDIPLTSPDGTASHGIDFDPSMIGSLEILKGPAASIYGAGNGGVLLFKNITGKPGQEQLEAGYTGGSYGFNRLSAGYKTGSDKFSLSVGYTRQRYDGYRENGWGNKDIFNIFSQLFSSEKRTVNLYGNFATGSYGISGALDSTQATANPRQAIPYAKDNKTSVKRYITTNLGASQQYQVSKNISNATGIFITAQTLDHPYGASVYYNGYLKETTIGAGARSKFVLASHIGTVATTFTLGAEYMYQHQFGNTFTIINDRKGTWPETGDLYQDMITASQSYTLFVQGAFDLPHRFLLTAGASYNRLSYDITDLFKAPGHTDYSGRIPFPGKVSPRLGLVKLFSDNIAARGSVSYGYAPPPLWEINNFDGTLNKNIRPEDGINYEAGVRGTLCNKLGFDITAYQMYLNNAIVPVANANGTSSYKNAGSTNQKGLEAGLQYTVIKNEEGAVRLLKCSSGLTFNNYHFRKYSSESYDYNAGKVITSNYSGNQVTGVVPATVTGGIDLVAHNGMYCNAIFYYYSRTPINDANTYYNKAYSLLNTKLGYKHRFHKITADLFAGVNNAFNTHYSSFINLNADATAFGKAPAWYNPSPGVNYYGGVKLQFNGER